MSKELELEERMYEGVPIADAMEQAQAVLDEETPPLAVSPEHWPVDDTPIEDDPAACWCGITHAPGVTHPQPEDAPPPVEAAAPEQAELFPPPPPPPFDFEKAYEELARLDQRARNKKRAWEACKRDTKEAREAYDEALEDVHTGFTKIDSARREWLRQQQLKQPVLVPCADVVPEAESAAGETKPPEDETEEGGENLSDLEQTIDPEETQGEDVPDEKPETSSDTPSD